MAALAASVARSSIGMPLVGLGTWKAGPGVVREAVQRAITLGYRHIDCACDYGNEKEVGEGIRAALDAGTCTREELWVTSKLWNTFHAKEHVGAALRRSLDDLQLEYLDLYLIHFPIPLKYVDPSTRYPPEWVHDPTADAPTMILADVPVRETWEAMELAHEAGLARNVGVSNFNCQLLSDVLTYAKVKPAVNQIEVHPYLQQDKLLAYCASVGVEVTGFSPLGSASYIELGATLDDDVPGILNEPALATIAEAHGKTPAQVALRYTVQRGCSIVPKSTNSGRLQQNLDLFAEGFVLSEEEMTTMGGLERNLRFNDPGVFCKFMGMPAGCPIHN